MATKKLNTYLVPFPDKGGQWRWRELNARNGQIVATSHQKFASKWSAKRAATRQASLRVAAEVRDE